MARQDITGYYYSNELVQAQVYWRDMPNKIIMRPGTFPFLEIMLKNSPMFFADFNALKESNKREVTAHSLDRSPAPTSTTLSCTHTACCGDCTETELTWTPIVAKNICMSYARHLDNMFNWDQVLANQLQNREMDMLRDLELGIMAYLLANQTTVHNGVAGLGTWVNDIFRIPIANRTEYLSYIYSMMLANNYQGFNLDWVNTLSLNAQYSYVNQQGAGNSFNLNWQNAVGNMHVSTNLPVTAGYFGDCLIIPEGSVGIVPWIRKINRIGKEGSDAGKWTKMDSLYFPGQITWAVHITNSCGDTTATNGDVQDYIENYELSSYFGMAMTPLAGGETPIYHGGLFAT